MRSRRGDEGRSGGGGYLDLTGNDRILLPEPGLFIETQGASEDPNREERPARSLRGAKAGRVARALIEMKAPPGVRELAALTKIDAGYVSRVLSLLDSEALITRGARGRIESVDWPALLRRRAHDAPIDSGGHVGTFLEPPEPSLAGALRLSHRRTPAPRPPRKTPRTNAISAQPAAVTPKRHRPRC